MDRGPKWSRDQLEDAARLFEAGVGPFEMVKLRPHWPLSTVKKLHVKLKRDMPLVRDVTTTVAQSWSADAHVKLKRDMPLVRDVTTTVAQYWSADARAGLAAFLDKNPEASIVEVARHMHRA